MAEYNHFYAEGNTQQTTTSATFVKVDATNGQIDGTALAANTKYLIVARAIIGGSSPSDVMEFRVNTADDTDIESKSASLYEYNFTGAVQGITYFFVHSFTTDATPADVYLEYQIVGGSTARCDQYSLLLIDLDDFGIEGTDYFEDINAATGTTIAATPTHTHLAEISGLTSGDRYLVLGYAKIGIGIISEYFDVQARQGTTTILNWDREEGEDTREERVSGMVAIKSAGETNIWIGAFAETVSTHTDEGSYLIAFHEDKFEDLIDDFVSASVTANAETTLATVTSYTPTVNGNHALFGSASKGVVGTGQQALWIEDGTTEIRTGDSSPVHDGGWSAGTEDNEQKITLSRISIAATKTYNLQGETIIGSGEMSLRALIVVNLNKPFQASLETVVRPVSDVAAAGWDTAPTASQPLWDQLDEASPSDTDYIFTETP